MAPTIASPESVGVSSDLGVADCGSYAHQSYTSGHAPV